MNDITFTAHRLDQHRAAQLNRENEIRRSQAERTTADDAAKTGIFSRLFGATHRASSIRPATAR